MAIIAFWGGDPKENGQTLSIAAIATHMAIEHNYRIFLIDATFDDDTLSRCFWKVNNARGVEFTKLVNKGKMDISSGAEGLVSAVASNKATPEIITNFTKVVFKNRLEVITGLKTTIMEEFNKSLMLYKDLLKTADKYYDMVFVDCNKTMRMDTTKAILDASHIIVYNFTQNLRQIDAYSENMMANKAILKKDKVIPLLTNAEEESKYNVKNVQRYIKERDLSQVLHNNAFKEAASEAGVANFFIKSRLSNNINDANSQFVNSVEEVCKTIDYKLEELKYKV